MHYIEQFLRFEYASEILIVAGALLVVIGVLKILRSSLKMLFWVVLSGVGAMSLAYGMKGSGLELPYPKSASELDALLGPGREISADVLRVMCERLEETITR